MASRAPEFSAAVPALTAERPVTWPKRTRARLANGLEVVLAEAHSIPKFHGELYFRAGNALVSGRSTGLAEMTATLVRTGTSKRASRQIEEDLRRLGADLGSSAGQDTSAIGFAGLSEFAEPLLQLVNSILDGFLAVKREDIQRVAKKYLVPQNRAIVFRAPVNAGKKEAA